MDIPVHLNKLSTMRQMMTANGDHVSDKEFKDILLNSLPPSWEPYTASFLGFSNSSHEHGSTTSALTMQQIISILSEESQPQKKKGSNMVYTAAGSGDVKRSVASVATPTTPPKSVVSRASLNATYVIGLDIRRLTVIETQPIMARAEKIGTIGLKGTLC